MPDLKHISRLTLTEAHTTLGQIVALREKAAAMSDEELLSEHRRLVLQTMATDAPAGTHNAARLWEAVVRAERARRRQDGPIAASM